MMQQIKLNFGLSDKISLDDITDGFWEWDLSTDETYFSPQWKKTLGYENNEIENHVNAWKNLIHPEDKDYVLCTHGMYLEKQIPKLEVRYRIRTREGSYKFILVRGKAVWDQQGRPIYLTGTHTDITDYMITYNALRESEERYRKAVETSPNAVLRHDYDKISYVNSAGIKLLGAKDENEIIGKTIFDFIHPRFKQAASKRMQRMLIEKKTVPLLEQKMITLDGRIIDVKVTSNIHQFNGEDNILTYARDITANKNLFRELKESEQKYSKLIELSPDAIIISDRKKIVFINNAGIELLGFPNKEDLLEKEFALFAMPKYQNMIKNRINYLKKNEKYSKRTEIQLLKKDGSIIDVEIASTELLYNGKRAILDVIRDISERKKSETKLQIMAEENKRLFEEAIEYDRLKTEFFSTISHELKTPLNIILSAMQLLDSNHCKIEKCIYNAKMNKYIAMSKQNCYRLLRLINNLIDITRLDTGFMKMRLQNFNIVNIIEDITLSVSEYAHEKGLELTFDTDTEEKIMACDADKIERVVLNLLSNSIKFTEPGGYIKVNLFDNGESVSVIIEDSGIGIPEDKLEVIFERFRQVDATLTRRREGSGIGLSLVKALVESHNGNISVKSQVGKGSEFIIELPVKIVEVPNGQGIEVDAAKVANVERINIEFSDIYS